MPAKTFSISPTISCVITDVVWWCFNDKDLPVTVTLGVCMREGECMCVSVVGDLAGPVDDGRAMRWSHAVEIRPVCPPPLPTKLHTHTHTPSINATPCSSKLPHNATCYLTITFTHSYNPPPSRSYPHLSTLWSSMPRWQPSAPPTVCGSMSRYL